MSTGNLLHEKHLHTPEAGRLLELDNTGIALAFNSSSDLYVLTNEHTIRRIDAVTVEVLWGWNSAD